MIHVLHYSPHDEDDGIAKYQENYVSGMKDSTEVANDFFDVSPLAFRALSPQQQHEALEKLKRQLTNYDILHIQHEFGLFAEEDFAHIVQTAKEAGKKVVVSVHLSPGYAIKSVKLGGVGPRSWVNYLRQKRHRKRMIERHIAPMAEANQLLVHTDITANALKDFGVDPHKIVKIPHPVPQITPPPKSDLIATKLHKKPGDIIYCTVGMIHRYKGVFDAVKALKFLPANYKLAIIGGMHPISEDVPMYNDLCDLIDQINLKDRVYITGFVKDDTMMNAYIQECDVCVFPYNNKYYANASSGAINLAIANSMPVIAYPTTGFKEIANDSEAVVLCDTFAYYELVRELERIDTKQQRERSSAYAATMAWPKMADELIKIYQKLARA